MLDKLPTGIRQVIAVITLMTAMTMIGIMPVNAASTASISGTITAPQGTDLTQISVQAVGNPGGSTQARADGTYQISGLPAGSYTIYFTGQNLVAQELGPVSLQDGQALTGTNVSMIPGATISGKITGPAQEEFTYLRVSLFDLSGARKAQSGVVNTDGTYSIKSLPSGNYKIRVEDQGHYIYDPTPTFIPPKYASRYYPAEYSMSSAQGVTVATGATASNINVSLVLGGKISGHLAGITNANEYACIGAFPVTSAPAAQSAAMSTPGETPGRAASLVPEAAAGDPCYELHGHGSYSHTSARNDGNYTIYGLPPGSYRIYQGVPFSYSLGQQYTSRAPQWFTGKVLYGSAAPLTVTLGGSVSGIDLTAFPERTFTDVPAGTQFHREISWLGSTGISTGFPNGTYAPVSSVNRDAMAAFLFRLAGSPDYTPPASSPFTDVATDNPFYKQITWLAAQGISTGWIEADGTKTYRPLSSVNRDAMAAFLYRFAGNPAFTPPASSPFADVTTNNQFYKQITWLANTGITTGWTEANGSKTFRPVNAVNRDAMAAFLHRFGVWTGSIY